jgi:PHD/YefM family antitoxin component YafN of YafNO toxin-antitoxin module
MKISDVLPEVNAGDIDCLALHLYAKLNSETSRDDVVRVVDVRRNSMFIAVSDEYLESLLETIDVLSNPKTIDALKEGQADLDAGRLHDYDDVKKELDM